MNDKRAWYRDEYLKSDHWKELKAQKLHRFRKCAFCRSDKNLDVHHLKYNNIMDVTTYDLRVICRRCHEEAHAVIDAGMVPPARRSTSNDLLFNRTKWLALGRRVRLGDVVLEEKDAGKALRALEEAEKVAFHSKRTKAITRKRKFKHRANEEFRKKPWADVYAKYGLGSSRLSKPA